MSAAQPQIYSVPFDAVAERYDESFTSTKIGQAQRAAVWKKLANAFRPSDRVLEIGCGTGTDACFLAKRGVTVVACDSSSQMIAVATRKIQERGLQHAVHPLVLPAESIASLQRQEQFDGAFSNFGALNCVQDLRQLASDLATLLKPGATALLCWMGPCCAWETAWYLALRRPGKAFRRLHREAIIARIAEGAFATVRYPLVRSLARTFAPAFRLQSITGIGVTVPPSYVEPWAEQFPRLLQFCVKADSFLGRCPGVRVLADHVLLRFQRTKATLDGN